MKAFEIAEEFRQIVLADEAFTAVNLRTGQSDDEPAFPCIVFDCGVEPIAGSAQYLTCEVAMTVESDAHGSPADHAAIVDLLRTKFFGASQATCLAARAAIKTAFNARGRFRMLGRGHDAPAEPKLTVEAGHFKTPIFIATSLAVLPPAP